MANKYDELVSALPTNSKIIYEDYFDLFPSLVELAKTPQDHLYHAEGDVWTHTKMVCDELLKLPEYQNGTDTDKFILFYSALLHDISKPACTKLMDNNRISSAGHSRMGAIDTRVLLWEKEVPFDLKESICNIVEVHQLPFYAFHFNPNKKQRDPLLLGTILSNNNNMSLLFALAKADMLGRICPTLQDNLDNMELFKELCLENNIFDNKKVFPDEYTRVKYFRSEGAISPDYPFFYEKGASVTVMSGLPATGKDYFIQKNYPDLPVIGFDLAEKDLGLKHGENNGMVLHYVQDKAKEFLREKQPFVFNATHIVKDLRDKTLDLLYSYNAEVNIVYLEENKSTIFSRNNQRDTTLSNEHILKMLNRWDIPKSLEGHSVSYHVNQSKSQLKKKR